MSMPEQKPHRSKQDYCTPDDFLTSVKKRLHINEFYCDLAASMDNTVNKGNFFSEEVNSLTQDWVFADNNKWSWCNPPFSNITPWVEKGFVSGIVGAHIAMLVPASVGSNWWAEYVDGKAYCLFLSPRLTFKGCLAPYPKDCALLLFQPEVIGGYECWRWK